MITRRSAMIAVPVVLLGCSATPANVVTLQQVQLYTNDVVNAVSAAAQEYIASGMAKASPTIAAAVVALQTLNATVQDATVPTTVQATVTEIVNAINQLLPVVAPYLGPAAVYVPLALAVLQAFVQSLPLPTNAPPVPPAALHEKAMQFHRK